MARPRQHGERVSTAVRIPVALHARLDAIAEERDTSINNLIVKAAQHYLDHVLLPLGLPSDAARELTVQGQEWGDYDPPDFGREGS